MQNSVRPHKSVPCSSREQVVRGTSAEAGTIWDCVLCTTLHSHIRFLKALRSTASSILSHFHTLCSTSASGDSSCQNWIFQPISDPFHHRAVALTTCGQLCDEFSINTVPRAEGSCRGTESALQGLST